MPRLSLIHRLTAVLSGALLLQLSLLGSWTQCRMHGDYTNGHRGAIAAGHPDHHPGGRGAHAPTVSADESAGMPMAGCGNFGSGKSCDAPWTPSGCAVSSCITATSAMTAPSVSSSTSPTHAVLLVASAQMPIGPAFAPELPPPRA